LCFIGVTRGNFSAGLEIFRSQVRFLRELLVVIQRTGATHSPLDQTEHAQDGRIIAPQILGRIDLQPGHAVVGFFEVVFRFGGQISRAPPGEEVIARRAGDAEQDERHRDDG